MSRSQPYDRNAMASYFQAVSLSHLAHVGQYRRDTNIPYWTHASLVSATVAEWGGSAEQVEAALVHDVVEDTTLTIDTIRAVMGENVAVIVGGLTADSKISGLNWYKRKLQYTLRFVREADSFIVHPACYLPKVADIYSNLTSTVNYSLMHGVPSITTNTFVGYVALAMICLHYLEKYESAGTSTVARTLVLEKIASIRHRMDTGGAETVLSVYDQAIENPIAPLEWYKLLESEWCTK